MASSSGNSSQSQKDDMMDQKKRKRMQSNRESARKSRMKKQQHLDDLTNQINKMKKDNEQILATINITTPQYVKVEADNCVLKAQMSELSQRLDYLNEIINLMSNNNCTTTHCTSDASTATGLFEFDDHHDHDLMNSSWNLMYINQQPIMADMLQY